MSVKKENMASIIAIVLLVAVALISFFPLGSKLSKVETYKVQVDYLDGKVDDVKTLTLAATGASLAISLLPNDNGTPIADKIMDVAGLFGIALGAVFLEKYLLTIIGLAVFKIVIPIACVAAIVSIVARNQSLLNFAKKLFIYGILISLIVPTSVKVSQIIEDTYNFTVEDSVAQAKVIQDTNIQNSDVLQEAKPQTTNKNNEKSVLDKLNEFVTTATDKANEVISTVSGVVSGTVSNAKNLAQDFLQDLLEKLAITIVTSCLIPIAVFLAFAALTKAIMGIDLSNGLIRLKNVKKPYQNRGSSDDEVKMIEGWDEE